MDSIGAINAAMSTLDLGSAPVGQLGIGVSLGVMGNSRALALGAVYAPTQNFKINTKLSTSTGSERKTALGAGAVYYINLK